MNVYLYLSQELFFMPPINEEQQKKQKQKKLSFLCATLI